MKPTRNNILCIAASLFVLLFTAACSTTKRIPADEQLYTGVKKVNIVSADGSPVPADVKDQIREAVNVAPNNYFKMLKWRYPFPIGLWAYNHWSNPPKGFKHWLYEKFAEEPVLISDVRPEVRTKMIDEILDNNGFFQGSSDYTLNVARNPKKASVTYTINAGPVYLIDSVELLPDSIRL